MPAKHPPAPENEKSWRSAQIDKHPTNLDPLAQPEAPAGKLVRISTRERPVFDPNGLSLVFMGSAGSGHLALAETWFDQPVRENGLYTLDTLPGSRIWVTDGSEEDLSFVIGAIYGGQCVRGVLCVQQFQEDAWIDAGRNAEVESRRDFETSYRRFSDFSIEFLRHLPEAAVMRTYPDMKEMPTLRFRTEKGRITFTRGNHSDYPLINVLHNQLTKMSI